MLILTYHDHWGHLVGKPIAKLWPGFGHGGWCDGKVLPEWRYVAQEQVPTVHDALKLRKFDAHSEAAKHDVEYKVWYYDGHEEWETVTSVERMMKNFVVKLSRVGELRRDGVLLGGHRGGDSREVATTGHMRGLTNVRRCTNGCTE